MDEPEPGDNPEHPCADVLGAVTRQKEKAAERRRGMRQINRPEKYPGYADPIDRERPSQPAGEGSRSLRRDMLLHVPDLWKHVPPVRPGAVHDQRQPVQAAPDHKRPRPAM